MTGRFHCALLIAAAVSACGRVEPPAEMPRIVADTTPPEGTRPRIVLSIDRPIEWTFRFLNAGRVEARSVSSKAMVIPAVYAATDVDAFFVDLPKRLARAGSQAAAAPGAHGDQPITARSRAEATPEDFNNLAHDGGLYLVGRFDYDSANGTPCRTDFCRFTLEAGGFRDCPTHNEVRCEP